MRIDTAAIGIALAGLCLAACSGRHEAAGSGAAGNGAAAGKGADAGTAAAATATAASSPATAAAPRPGLWRMTIAADAMPRPMAMQMCAGTPAPGVNPFMPPPQAGRECRRNAVTRTAAGYAVDIECRMNGMTVTSRGEVSGDLSSHYTIAMKTRMAGPGLPAAMQAERGSTIEARYVGACPAGMAPGTAKPAG